MINNIDVIGIINKLKNNNYEAYLVGGAVRSILLNEIPSDYDITTNALPENVKKIFESDLKYKVVDYGIKYGTVGIFVNGKTVEITTYRIDDEYLDNRHPTNVIYTRSLYEDLKRRDFTINALALDDNIIDYFYGIKDLNSKLIRTVGIPSERFKEDSLRILRALRFSSVLGFDIEESTSNAIRKMFDNIINTSLERRSEEIKKMIDGKNLKYVLLNYSDLLTRYLKGFKNFSKYIDLLAQINEFILKIIVIYYYNQKEFLVDNNSLLLSKKDVNIVLSVFDIFNSISCDIYDEASIRYLFRKHDEEIIFLFLKAYKIVNNISEYEYENIFKKYRECSRLCNKISDLAVDGNDLISIGMKGRQIGEHLNEILELVINNKINNDKVEILEYLSKKANY